jgi:diguanylate cyclase (GGDEF)-like protein/PAS domain S-box-containing protein
MKLPWRAKVVVATTVAVGLAVAVLMIQHLLAHGHSQPTARQFVIAVLFGALVIVSWFWPLIIYVGDESEAVHLDEGFLVALLLLVPMDVTIGTFAVATVIAQIAKRRAVVKSAFNVAETIISIGAAAGVFELLSRQGASLPDRVGPAALAAATFFVVNSAVVSAILAATGGMTLRGFLDALDVRLMIVAGGVVVAITTAVITTASVWALPLAILPILTLRHILSGHFEAHHDRERLNGLFRATLEANRTISKDDVTSAILESAKSLLRCSDAELVEKPSESDALIAPVALTDQKLWLTVTGRSRNEPFDAADQALLEALAAVGAGALSNASLYYEVRYQRERLAAITASLGEGVCAISKSGYITFMNPMAASMLGWEVTTSLEDLELLPNLELGPPAPSFILGPAMRAMATGETISSYDTRFKRADGEDFYVAFTVSPVRDDDNLNGAVLVFRDISERKRFEEELARHAFQDALSGLPNRRLFLDHLEHALRRSERSLERHAILFMDIDRFKMINDSLGHNAGDMVLTSVAERLQASLRPGDMLARFGGDEFTILLEGVGAVEDAVAAAQRILDRLRQPISLPEGHEVVVSASIGIAFTSHMMSRDDVLHDADVAMYQAKVGGRGGRYEVFDVEAMGSRSAERIDLEVALRRALERDELEVYYQPLFSLHEPHIIGAEALVRWHHPTRGFLEPGQFIGLAEETGLILPIGRFVLEQACRQARMWRETFGVTLEIGINLSARQFQQAGLADEIEEVLRATGVEASQVCLEITESLAIDNVEATAEILYKLRSLGVHMAIDDFGTGYSALGYLTSFPIDIVKIDRSFIDGVDTDSVKSAIVSSVVTLSQAIGTTTVVEGVETAAELAHLKGLGCDVAQGFYLARPMAAEALETLIVGDPSLLGNVERIDVTKNSKEAGESATEKLVALAAKAS